MVNNKGEPAKTEKTWEDFVRALPKMEKNMLKENAPLQPKVIFHIIREEGEEEMSRFYKKYRSFCEIGRDYSSYGEMYP